MSHPSYPIPPLSTNFAAVPGPAGIPPPPPCQPPSFSLAPVPAPAPSPVVVVVAAARIGTSSARLPTLDSASPTRREGDTWQALPLPSTGRAAKKKAPGHRDASAAGHGPEQGQPAAAVKFKMVRSLRLLTILLAHPRDIEKVKLRIFSCTSGNSPRNPPVYVRINCRTLSLYCSSSWLSFSNSARICRRRRMRCL